METGDVDYYIFHQANKFMLNTIRKVCVLPKEKFYVNLNTTGNTVSSTVLIGLKDCLDKHIINKGSRVMVTGFGVGLSWGGTILKF
jgi:3-oxoacyl-[acyl-carrier-protein] synthase-3